MKCIIDVIYVAENKKEINGNKFTLMLYVITNIDN